MKKLMINVIAIIILANSYSGSVMKFSANFLKENPSINHEDLWHPHLKRNWISEKESLIVDNKNKIYDTSLSLIQLNQPENINVSNSADLNEILNNPKLSCGCRFIKQLQGENCNGEISRPNKQIKPSKANLSLIQENLKNSNLYTDNNSALHSNIVNEGITLPNLTNLQHLTLNSPSVNPINPYQIYLNSNLNGYLNKINNGYSNYNNGIYVNPNFNPNFNQNFNNNINGSLKNLMLMNQQQQMNQQQMNQQQMNNYYNNPNIMIPNNYNNAYLQPNMNNRLLQQPYVGYVNPQVNPLGNPGYNNIGYPQQPQMNLQPVNPYF